MAVRARFDAFARAQGQMSLYGDLPRKVRHGSSHIALEDLTGNFHLPINEVARKVTRHPFRVPLETHAVRLALT
jgi:hypothetical protein